MINFWKMFFVEQYDAKPGERAFIVGVPGYDYYGAIFAALELGIVLILDWPHCYNEKDLTNSKVSMFGTIDYVVYVDDFSPEENNIWDNKRNKMYSRHIITFNDIRNYNIKDGSRYKEIADRIVSDPKSVVVEYPSSGTTGYPKLITNTHKKIYLMSQRIGRMFKFCQHDRIMHITNLNHGHGLCLHFLPGFMLSNEHYSKTPNNFKQFVKFINDQKINRMLLYTGKLLLDFLAQTEKLDHPLSVLTLYQITPEIIRAMREKGVAQINSTFGDTAIGAGFLLKTETPDTDLNTYSPSNYGPQIDDFWQFEIRNGVLWVKSDQLEQDWMTSNDQFEIIDSNYYFRGRADTYKINDEWVVLADIEQAVRNAFYSSANIAVDLEMQQVYLAIWQEDPVAEKMINDYFQSKYKNVRINYVIRNQKYDEFFNSRKIDNSKIRDYCRTQLGIK
jgi:acyl-coenzyme A synthetase/AMP-(fatty) acid ligase